MFLAFQKALLANLAVYNLNLTRFQRCSRKDLNLITFGISYHSSEVLCSKALKLKSADINSKCYRLKEISYSVLAETPPVGVGLRLYYFPGSFKIRGVINQLHKLPAGTGTETRKIVTASA